MGICTKCGYLSADAVNPEDPPVETHVCHESKVNLAKGMANILYRIMVYADPASTVAQKNNAMSYIQTRRAWIEAHAAEIQDYIS